MHPMLQRIVEIDAKIDSLEREKEKLEDDILEIVESGTVRLCCLCLVNKADPVCCEPCMKERRS